MKSSVIPVLLLLVPLLRPLAVSADPIGWSTPRQLAPDTAAFVRQAPHSTATRDTALWALWFEDRGTGQHSLKASRFSNGSWLEPESVASDTTWVGYVEAVVDADLNPWAVWNHNWSRRQGDSWTSPGVITRDTAGPDYTPGVASDPVQGIWAIWPRIEGDSVSILSSYCPADSWQPPVVVDQCYFLLVPYAAALTAPPGGKVRSVWTTVGIYSATWDGDSWQDREPIPGVGGIPLSPGPSICSDSTGGTWVTWCVPSSGETTLIRCARYDGTGWADTWRLASGGVTAPRGMLCCDDRGWIWAVWTDYHRTTETTDVCVRYFDGDSWSDRCVIATRADLAADARIAAARGRVWVTWTERESDDRRLLYYSHTLPAGIAEQNHQRLAAVQVSPTVVRAGASVRLYGIQPGQTVQLLDAAGRKVGTTSELRPRDLCTSMLSPGVYFVRTTGGGQPVSRKVLVVQ